MNEHGGGFVVRAQDDVGRLEGDSVRWCQDQKRAEENHC